MDRVLFISLRKLSSDRMFEDQREIVDSMDVSEQLVAVLPRYEFHIASDVRRKYEFNESLFSTTGNVIFADFRSARIFAQKVNAKRQASRFPDRAVRASHVNAMGLIDEIYHYVVRLYEESVNPKVFHRAIEYLGSRLGKGELDRLLTECVTHFPPLSVHREEISPQRYLRSESGDKSHTEVTLEELMLLYFANFNPAFSPYKEFFDDGILKKSTVYIPLIEELDRFFTREKPFGPDHEYLFDLLRAPILAHPDSLEAQLKFIKKKWGLMLSDKYLKKILGSMDFIKEEEKPAFGGGAKAETRVPTYSKDMLDQYEYERFTSDVEWMPRVVILAKNTYVWLYQLSKKYQRPINRLDEIPDEELDQLARWNFTGLWLIGIWERSPASQRIKQISGNPEAVSSAYSVFDYRIADDLGGELAFSNFAHRAWQRGIRLAGDMVPNHMGIFSRWVIEKPGYFIQSSSSPFPSYRFTGPDLSNDPDIEIRIEDGYWSKSDAAVVFQRRDRRSGDVRYIYHGNDGTGMPWNDTAQLDFLQKEVREAVIQLILHVARKFSIIRFDAAMTLAKKHYQRLWYPEPGKGGDIPSRSDHSMERGEFNGRFPDEFWREVVDRLNAEMPNTLLLAEAFWMMEGFFVRTLGMHRVYNSAFMHMLMREENAKYRSLIKNTLEFNPEILKRYVNFMSNPDEQTAIAQFGTDDKYFGIALMMVTLPGLPMFAHGQVEGYTEKYGMEYKRSYYDESPNEYLVRRHEQEIFPVMKKRHLFSQVENFELYDFVGVDGKVNENVFAYSNASDGERALIFYHNKYEECKGWIRLGSGKIKQGENGGRSIGTRTLGDALGLRRDEKMYYVFKDHKQNLEYLRSGKELHERGMYAELKAFGYHVFLDFREIYDATGEYERLANFLQGKGVPEVRIAMQELRLQPLHQMLRDLISRERILRLSEALDRDEREATEQVLNEFSNGYRSLVTAAGPFSGRNASFPEVDLRSEVTALRELSRALRDEPDFSSFLAKTRMDVLLSVLTLRSILGALEGSGIEQPSLPVVLSVFSELQCEKPIFHILRQFEIDESGIQRIVSLLKILLTHGSLLTDSENLRARVGNLLNDMDVTDFLGVNAYRDAWYYRKEGLEELLDWLFLTSMLGRQSIEKSAVAPQYEVVRKIKEISAKSAYQVERFKEGLLPDGPGSNSEVAGKD